MMATRAGRGPGDTERRAAALVAALEGALLAAGHSNHQIARALFLSPRTAQRHVANIYAKIDAHCRAEATAYAIGNGLA